MIMNQSALIVSQVNDEYCTGYKWFSHKTLNAIKKKPLRSYINCFSGAFAILVSLKSVES